jgi:hypothetical protein
MALIVKGQFDLNNGIVLQEAYARVDTALSLDGNSVNAYPLFWANEQAWIDRKSTINVDQLSVNFTYAYNRALNGTDILSFANQEVKTTLESLGFTVIITEL